MNAHILRTSIVVVMQASNQNANFQLSIQYERMSDCLYLLP